MKDCINREIQVGDYVFSNNYIYEVKSIRQYSLVGFLANPSPTTKKKTLYGDQCCLITKEEYFFGMLKNE